jgi:hypothetical protein
MRAISLSRIAGVVVVLGLSGACADDPTGPRLVPDIDRSLPATMTLIPRSATIRPGHSMLLHATLVDGAGQAMQGVEFSWRSSDNAVAAVSAAGQVLGKKPGRAVITASARGKSLASTIQVQFHGPKEPLEPEPKPGRER